MAQKVVMTTDEDKYNLLVVMRGLESLVYQRPRGENGRLKFKKDLDAEARLSYLIDEYACFWGMDNVLTYMRSNGNYVDFTKLSTMIIMSALRAIETTCIEKVCVFGAGEARSHVNKYIWLERFILESCHMEKYVIDNYIETLKERVSKYK